MRSTILGLPLGIIIVGSALYFTSQDFSVFFNVLSLVLVFGGTLSVAIMTYGASEVHNVFHNFFRVFKTDKFSEEKIINDLIEISAKMHQNPNYLDKALKSNVHPFIFDGLQLIKNNLSRDQIQTLMKTSVNERGKHFNSQVEMLQVIAKYPPAFGMIGTIIGLVAVLQSLDRFEEVSKLGPNMAIALITTLYGLFMANYIFNPVGDSLAIRSKKDLKIRRIIISGVLMIKDGEDPIYFSEMIKGHLLPGNRKNIKSLPNFNDLAA